MFPHLQCSVMAPKKVLWHPPILWNDHCYLKRNGLPPTAVSKVTKPRVTEWGSNIFMSMSYIKRWTIPERPSTHKLKWTSPCLPVKSNRSLLPSKVVVSAYLWKLYLLIAFSYHYMCVCVCVCVCMESLFWGEVKVTQSCPTLWDSMDYSSWNSPGQNTGVGNFPFSRGSFQPRDWIQVSCTAGRFFTNWAIREAYGSASKESAHNVGELGLIPGLERSPGKEKATHFSILTWRIPWTV